MSKVTIILDFDPNAENQADVKQNEVPLTLVLESLQNVSRGLAAAIVEKEGKDIPEEDLEGWLDAKIDLDKEMYYSKFKKG